MLNSQFPYNELPKLQDIVIEPERKLTEACGTCWKTLYQLHGFLEAFENGPINGDLLLLQLADARHSFDLDKKPIAISRVFEAYSSENALGDDTLDTLFAFLAQYRQTDEISLDTLSPAYLLSGRKKTGLSRDRKDINIRSYHTNLTLYTPPAQASVIKSLKEDLEYTFRNPRNEEGLIQMCLCHFQLRALAPYNALNDHAARVFSQLWIKSLKLNFSFLPFSRIISENREAYQLMMREVAGKGRYADWCLYLVQITTEAATYLLARLKDIQSLRKNTYDLITKYTEYPLPAELLGIVFSRPFIKPKYITEALQCHRQTAYAYLGHMVRAGILVEKRSGREKLYLHKQLLDVLSN